MNGTAQMLLVILLGVGLLFFALKFGTIGGGGAGAKRDENPILFWIGITITAVITVVAISILIWTLLGLPPPLSAH